MSDLTQALEALLTQLEPATLRRAGAAAFTSPLPDGVTLELRYLESLDALCMAAPLGRLLRSSQTEAAAELMMSNLLLAGKGHAHFALNTATGDVVLCRTAPGATRDAPALAAEAKAFLELWQRSREAMAGSGLVA